jgi:hypothetical protein
MVSLLLRMGGVLSNRRRTWRSVLFIAVAGGLSLAVASVPPFAPLGIERLPDGNTLIADYGSFS